MLPHAALVAADHVAVVVQEIADAPVVVVVVEVVVVVVIVVCM